MNCCQQTSVVAVGFDGYGDVGGDDEVVAVADSLLMKMSMIIMMTMELTMEEIMKLKALFLMKKLLADDGDGDDGDDDDDPYLKIHFVSVKY